MLCVCRFDTSVHEQQHGLAVTAVMKEQVDTAMARQNVGLFTLHCLSLALSGETISVHVNTCVRLFNIVIDFTCLFWSKTIN